MEKFINIKINVNWCALLGHKYDIIKVGKYRNGTKFKITSCSRCANMKFEKLG